MKKIIIALIASIAFASCGALITGVQTVSDYDIHSPKSQIEDTLIKLLNDYPKYRLSRYWQEKFIADTGYERSKQWIKNNGIYVALERTTYRGDLYREFYFSIEDVIYCIRLLECGNRYKDFGISITKLGIVNKNVNIQWYYPDYNVWGFKKIALAVKEPLLAFEREILPKIKLLLEEKVKKR